MKRIDFARHQEPIGCSGLKRSVLFALFSLTLLPVIASTQTTEGLTVGRRIRVSVDKRLTGTLVSLDRSNLTLDAGPPSGHLRFLLDEVRRVEVSKGRRSRLVKASLGMLATAAVGAVWGANQKSDWLFSKGDYTMMGLVYGAPIGFVVGLALPPGERWERVSIPPPPRQNEDHQH